MFVNLFAFQTKQEIETLEGDILHLKQAIEAKKAPMMVSQERLIAKRQIFNAYIRAFKITKRCFLA